MFKDALRDIVDGTEGGLAGLLMDASGIALETYARTDAAGRELDITTVGIEYGVVLGAIRRAAEMLEAGAAREVTVGTDRMVTLIRTLDETYFLALAVHPSGNVGKGRYLMRVAAPKLLEQL